jgi:hypothetical protein
MKLLRPVLLLALAVAVTAGPAAAGGDAGPPLYPSVVNVQLVRAQALLEKATAYEDEGDIAKAVAALAATRSHMRKAWIGAKYVIDNAPPPVAGDGGFRVTRAKVTVKPKAVAKAKAKAHASGGAIPGASPFADQYTTAVGVLTLQHEVATTAIGMLDNASGPLLDSVSKSLFAALNARDQAIAYIHSIEPPPVASDGGVSAHSSGAPVAGGWATVMPSVAPFIDDELQQVDGVRASLNLSPGRKRILDDVELQDTKTQRTITQYWPPVVGG